ncbi:uncharacterized protein K452DRAFT_300917 [Aplosporella prunicola CBS 121167]|uniref:Zn(2)-C6 fungal-type domain-containing protein n=1 Tax=Aplosporella prunicola CBS 121167 TaxID=1176127 RepID=A0A6A6B3R4_9PEZI|nr:uncharacterized protein K452DRAFT_300917 [Aplosporella prunicola CBS 121167]KAF2138862.1 hypothetical protein K452DRAFT_300917 [Aplosporella prunicola CBS 121167]
MANATPSDSHAALSTSPPAKSLSQSQQHTRTYQACIPCRRRKVRCDLGPVDNPHEPPCVRCRRESKECFFSATRRKRKPQDGGEGIDDDGPSDYEVRNGRKRLRDSIDSTPRHPALPTINANEAAAYDAAGTDQPLTPGGSVGRYQPLRRPTDPQLSTQDDAQKVNNETTAILQSKEVFSGHDALNLLFEAAGRTGDMDHDAHGSTTSQQRPMSVSGNTPGSQANLTSPATVGARPYTSPTMARSTVEPVVDPAISQSYTNEDGFDEAGYQSAIRAWSKFRFVRAGWFTAKEALAYMDYFYKYLSPLTPIVVPNFERYESHITLLTEEPMLVVTLLTVSSRYMTLTGPGSSSRPFAIHEKLWNYLQGMIDRMIWGQEQFGGGFCGAGAQQSCDVNPLSRKGLRALGTVESLMLLTEWHPRALHFPPGDDDDELMAREEPVSFAETNSNEQYRGIGGQRIDSWLEPCWRSDRMCWMLLGNALALAYEIGVFDETSEAEFQEENKNLPPAKVEAYFRRKNHLKELLLIYITQTSGRVGLTSMLPRSQRDASFLKSPDERLHERFEVLKRTGRIIREQSGTSPGRERRINSQEMVLYFWMEIAAIMERGNQQMFGNRRHTRELIKSEEYKKLLAEFQPMLRSFREHLDRYRHLIPPLMCDVLTIEYEYSRVYLNSLALQAVVERCIHNPLQNNVGAPPNGTPLGSLPSAKDPGAIPAALLMRMYGNDRFFIREVIDGCRNVLTVVVKGLEPGGYLKHAPVRTFFRIISVAIILLKTFALGATEDDVAISLGLMEEAVSALRGCIVDDVHVGNRFADLLMTLITCIKSRFVRMTTGGSGRASMQASRATSQSPNPPGMPGVASQQAPDGLGRPPQFMPPPGQGYPHVGNNANGAAPQWPAYGSSNSGLATPDGTGTGTRTPSLSQNHPLWGISTETYDPSANNISIMPPPSFGMGSPYQPHNHMLDGHNGPHFGGNGNNGGGGGGANGLGDGNAYGTSPSGGGGPNSSHAGNGAPGGGGPGGPDWLALPLDPLLNGFGPVDVNATTFGPDVGGYDLLDVLLNGSGLDGLGGNGGGGGGGGPVGHAA